MTWHQLGVQPLLHDAPSSYAAACSQVISPHEVMGAVEVVEHLSTVQDKVYEEATVLVVHNVTGEGTATFRLLILQVLPMSLDRPTQNCLQCCVCYSSGLLAIPERK